MKTILPLLFVALLPTIAQADIPKVCSTLQGADLGRNIGSPSYFSNNVAFSSNRQQIALHQVFHAKQQVTFKLFDSNSGKLLKQKTLDNYEERDLTDLQFSPQDRIVYLRGMSYSSKSSADYGSIPFWDLARNQLVFSPCSTAMGVREVQFSEDETVAFSSTVDSFSSLCSTQEEKALALVGQDGDYLFNPKSKKLYANYVDTSPKNYQSLLKHLGEDIKHVSLYPSPVSEHPYQSDSRNIFVSLLLGTVPNHRQLIAKSEGERLTLSYWDHAISQNPPKKLYQHEFTIAELNSGAISVPFFHSQLSPDKKRVAIISKTGVVLAFDIETGELLWKRNLPATTNDKGKLRYGLEDNLLAEHGATATALVIKRDVPTMLYLYDWQTGQQRELVIPDGYSLFYKQYGQQLVFKAIQDDAHSLLLVNWQTGQQQKIKLPDGFSYFSYDQFFIADSQQLVLKDHTATDTVLVLNLGSGKYQVLKAPYPDARYYSSEYTRLGDKYYRINSTTKRGHDGEDKVSIQLYDVTSKQARVLQTADVFLHSELVERVGKTPEYHTVAYDGMTKQMMFCRFSLGTVAQ